MLFDEVTSALDPELVGEVLSTPRNVSSDGMTMILRAHEMQFARDVADKVAFFDNGVIAEIGVPEKILAAPNPIAFVLSSADLFNSAFQNSWLLHNGLLPAR
ncbi:ABC-type polar amino acid transport system ATPase subunit [Rhizobium esperanzae]|uniref:ABC-type polar amino acid transport system ATPase subunit n=1 Tax=Rhizobium esperanzae TaxID=1967781 RepID=A0A7W6W3Q7_9HYPH|nr:ABC-type polar amino acid transport system ATPase subunit [Rhizobium esperanzae]